MQASRTTPRALAIIALLASLAAGCAGRAYQRAIDHRGRQVGAFVYPMTIDRVWEGVGQVLFELGFTAEADGPYRLRTDWRYTSRSTEADLPSHDDAKTTLTRRTTVYENYDRHRFLIQAKALDEGGCVLRVTKDEERSFEGYVNRWNTRDLDMEWELLRHLLPAEAARIGQQARAAAEKG